MNFTGDDINLLPKIMVFVVVEDDQIEEILADIATAIGTGKNGDGSIRYGSFRCDAYSYQ